MTHCFGEKRGGGKVGRGVELPVSWPRRPVGWWSGELCVCVARGWRAEPRWGMASGGVACVHPLLVLSGVGSEWWNGGLTRDWILRGAMRRVPGGWLSEESGLVYSRGGEASPNVSHECCSLITRPPKGGTQKSFLMVTGVFLHHSFQIKMRDTGGLCCMVVDSDGYLLFNEATQM